MSGAEFELGASLLRCMSPFLARLRIFPAGINVCYLG
jgi:hypothetical protein